MAIEAHNRLGHKRLYSQDWQARKQIYPKLRTVRINNGKLSHHLELLLKTVEKDPLPVAEMSSDCTLIRRCPQKKKYFWQVFECRSHSSVLPAPRPVQQRRYDELICICMPKMSSRWWNQGLSTHWEYQILRSPTNVLASMKRKLTKKANVISVKRTHLTIRVSQVSLHLYTMKISVHMIARTQPKKDVADRKIANYFEESEQSLFCCNAFSLSLCRQAGRQADRQAGRQAGRPINHNRDIKQPPHRPETRF